MKCKRIGILPVFLLLVLLLQACDVDEIPAVEPEGAEETTAAESMATIDIKCGDGTVFQMPLEDYVAGVVLAEVPASFELDALMAQAIAARTYGINRCRKKDKHPEGAVCLSAGCCQAYCSKEAYLQKGGTEDALNKIWNAVLQTSGIVLTYEGQLAETTYFSCSGGRTEDAVAVWGADVPYLQSVASPGEENAAHYTDTVCFSLGEFATKMQIDLQELTGTWLGDITYTDGGGVDRICIGGEVYKGTSVRQRLGLRSTAFSLSVAAESVTITTRGFGHRVGLSQYGAEAMAVSGSTYSQILSHYYPGTELKIWEESEN